MLGSVLSRPSVHIGAATDLRFRAGTVAAFRAGRNDRGMQQTVVVIDDNEPFRTWACDLLAREGYAVVGDAGAGADGLRLAESLRPDVLVLDVQLPDMSGFEVLRRLSDDAPAVVLISARDREDFGAAVLHSGARAFIGKSELSGRSLRAVLGD